ncbi:tryptophanyl-tRNA synthetase (chromatophore) [Paulinella micropora]|uniref:tryptophan--tRNA ligase n=1 Tax=Paulinella micropora TaxID=1928728 RepID=A0A1S6YJ75_9EUKA|nr:tryptophanyl-tRNA synthetase [Paulinella micropora]BBL86593.1 tryptophanyl-tRNA synthetase [Paulinella micropora]
MIRPRILSGAQPTGALHIGNWLGAIRNWAELQHSHETFLCVVDLHAITAAHDPIELLKNTRTTAALYLACGIDPEHSTVFIQSHISAHSELCWLLNCVTPLNWLERMIQFKEKSIKQGNNVSIGLLDYPVMMAADILLYNADFVPVGEDQKQHLELARDIAQQRINSRFGNPEKPIFKVPQALIMKEGARIMSLSDGRNKMSKSDPDINSRITLLDNPDLVTKKIKRAKTDSTIGLEFGNPSRPEADNLLTIYAILSGKGMEVASLECAEMGWGTFKRILTEAIVSALHPIQTKYKELMNDPKYLDDILRKGSLKACMVADETLGRVQDALGFLRKEYSSSLNPEEIREVLQR